MPSNNEKSQLKRARQSHGDTASDTKKPRRSERLSSQHNGTEKSTTKKNNQLPSPVTGKWSTSTEDAKDGTVTPPSQVAPRSPASSPARQTGLSSPPNDTQAFSQFIYPPRGIAHEVDDEVGEGVWGYLIPEDPKHGDTLVLRRRTACPAPNSAYLKVDGKSKVNKKTYEKQEANFERANAKGAAAGGYLVGRHPECDRVLNIPTISNRHCLLFNENKAGDTVAVLEDLSSNGTFVNNTMVGRNKRRELQDGCEIAILDQARFTFRYPRSRLGSGFHHQYLIQQQLGKGHFATVYLCVERSSGSKFAVKKFERRRGSRDRSMVEGLQQEIGVLMGVSHPNVLCLKDTFDEPDGVYLVLELALEGELFNWIVMKSKLSEVEARKVFIQLFQGLKYLHERSIVHRDIKPENILLVDKNLSIKLADFGLAKIIGEESFTTTLCGTPSYVAPEILENSDHRRYTRAVDVWSLGVVLYICLCGFPPFSDELYTPENPYTLSQQIKMGRFDYPSPYWDPVSDAALDLIDRMLTVDFESRISIDECLEHPWTTQRTPDPNESMDSTSGLTGAMGQLEFSRRKPKRERTLLSNINDIQVTQLVDIAPDAPPLKVFVKNKANAVASQSDKAPNSNSPTPKNGAPKKEPAPAAQRQPNEFMQLGGVPDEPLFADDAGSRYAP